MSKNLNEITKFFFETTIISIHMSIFFDLFDSKLYNNIWNCGKQPHIATRVNLIAFQSRKAKKMQNCGEQGVLSLAQNFQKIQRLPKIRVF